MNKLLSYLFTPFYYLVFTSLLLIFHPVQIVCRRVFGYNAHKKSVDVMSYLLVHGLKILGAHITINGKDNLPTDRPLIIIANHQSTFDIPPVVWIFRKHHPKFISKIELGKGIPSISYNLKHSGSALIDRNNRKQSVEEIYELGRRIESNNYAACIYPEGTRSRNGKVKRFKIAGISALLQAAPSALVVPFVIDGNWKLQQHGLFPMCFGVRINYSILDPIEPNGYNAEEIIALSEKAIKECLNQ